MRPSGSCLQKLFSGPVTGAHAARPFRQVERQVDVPAIGELKISRMDMETALATAAALDDVTGADREPTRQTICLRTHSLTGHDNSPAAPPTSALMPDQDDSSETV